jgi:C-terminal processing protease CtpA/Prc
LLSQPKIAADANTSLTANIGIGCTLTVVSGRLRITSLKPDGGAAASRLVKPGDFLLSLNGVPLESETQAKQLIVGPCGTSLEATLERDGKSFLATIFRGGPPTQPKSEISTKNVAEANSAIEAKATADAKAADDAAFKVDASSTSKSSDIVGLGLVVNPVSQGFEVLNVSN